MQSDNERGDHISAPPTAELLRSIVNDRLEIREALGELIDNAIDANAHSIHIEVGEKKQGLISRIVVRDDGDGCTDLVDMVQLGKHTEHRTTRLGRYGIGAKNAMLWLGGDGSTVQVLSTRLDLTRRLNHNWHEYASSGWRIPRERLAECSAEPGARGTAIEIRPCIRRFPEGKALETLLRELGYLYSPAIKRGVQIQIRIARRGAEPTVLRRWEPPTLSEIVDVHIEVGGRSARVYVGIVAEGEANPRPGITYVHGFRVVKPNCALGCGGMDYSGVCGWVELDRTWVLTKNKDDLSQHKDEIAEAVFEKVKPLLERSAARGQEIQFSALNDAVERQLNAMLGGPPDSKAVRKAGNENGTKVPTGTGRKHRRAAKEQDGATFRRRFGSLRISYQNLGDPEQLGQHSEGCVIVNSACPYVADARQTQNASTLSLIALIIFMESVRLEEASGQRRMRYQATGDLLRDMGKVLAAPALIDGRPLLPVCERPSGLNGSGVTRDAPPPLDG